jgi:hypothetical protein
LAQPPWTRTASACTRSAARGSAALGSECYEFALDRSLVFRTEYAADTLRGNLGLPVPANRHTRERRLVND